jgi:hypothetical protein
MTKLIIFAAFALALTTSAQAMPVAPVHEPASMITQIAAACGPGMTRRNGVCVSRVAKRQARRCERWNGGRARMARNGVHPLRAVCFD